jgi:hypothetical protein
MFRTFVAAALVASALAGAQRVDVFDRAGLLGACTPAATQTADGGQWLECRPGSLTGYPDLSQDACSRSILRGEVRYWLCPTALVGGRSTDESATR